MIRLAGRRNEQRWHKVTVLVAVAVEVADCCNAAPRTCLECRPGAGRALCAAGWVEAGAGGAGC